MVPRKITSRAEKILYCIIYLNSQWMKRLSNLTQFLWLSTLYTVLNYNGVHLASTIVCWCPTTIHCVAIATCHYSVPTMHVILNYLLYMGYWHSCFSLIDSLGHWGLQFDEWIFFSSWKTVYSSYIPFKTSHKHEY